MTHEYELVGVSPGPPIAKATDKTYYEIPSPQPPPTILLSVAPPSGEDVGVAKERVCIATFQIT